MSSQFQSFHLYIFVVSFISHLLPIHILFCSWIPVEHYMNAEKEKIVEYVYVMEFYLRF